MITVFAILFTLKYFSHYFIGSTEAQRFFITKGTKVTKVLQGRAGDLAVEVGCEGGAGC